MVKIERFIKKEELKCFVTRSRRYQELKKRIASLIIDKSELEEILYGLEELRAESLKNQVTGAPGIKALEEDLETEAMHISRRRTGNNAIYVTMIDIDHFGYFNKEKGEDVGNEVLKATAKTICESLKRKNDLIFRVTEKNYSYHLHGEEFLAIYSCYKDEKHQTALSLAERIRQRVEEESKNYLDRDDCNVTVSLGVTLWDKGKEDYSTAQKRADSYMQVAKTEGRNRVYCGDNEPLLYVIKRKLYAPNFIDDLAKSVPDVIKSAKGLVGKLATVLYDQLSARLN